MRLDLFLVQQKLAVSRTQAQQFIGCGYVFLVNESGKVLLSKASYEVGENQLTRIIVEPNHLQNFVSRAGLKLAGALDALKIDVTGKTVLDVGQSTGGFSDCLVQCQARLVVGVDVGHGQLHDKLKNHPLVRSIEGLNAKDLGSDERFLTFVPAGKFDLIVMDVSFISITKVMAHLVNFLKPEGDYLFLVKPQFECGREFLDKNGIVNDSSIYPEIEKKVRSAALEIFKNVESYTISEILGKDGNREYFIYGKNLN